MTLLYLADFYNNILNPREMRKKDGSIYLNRESLAKCLDPNNLPKLTKLQSPKIIHFRSIISVGTNNFFTYSLEVGLGRLGLSQAVKGAYDRTELMDLITKGELDPFLFKLVVDA